MTPELFTACASLIAALTGLVTAAGVILVAIMNKRQTQKLDVQEEKLDAVKHLVNSGMEEQLRLGMISANTLASVKRTAANIAMAKAATHKYEAHIRNATMPSRVDGTRIGEAIIELKSAAEETSVSADKTVAVVDKHAKP